MINFDDEISKFKPSLEISGIEDELVRADITDMQDVMMEILKYSQERS